MVVLSSLLILISILGGFVCLIGLIIKFFEKDLKFKNKYILITWGSCILVFIISLIIFKANYIPSIKTNNETVATTKTEELKPKEESKVENAKEEVNSSEEVKTEEQPKAIEPIQENKDSDTVKADTNNDNIPKSASNYKAKIGEVLEANQLGTTLTIKFKIQPSMTNKTTINQNGFNVEDLVLNQNCDQLDSINYWAVAEMSDGSISKVISFAVNKDLIQKIKDKKVLGSQIVDKADNVWILPSLKKK